MKKTNYQKITDVAIGEGTWISEFVNLYDCKIGDFCKIGPFVEIQQGVIVGSRVKIGSHTFICEGVEIEDGVFIGHGVIFTNDRYPRSAIGNKLRDKSDWKLEKTKIEKNASIGSGAVILPGIVIGENSIIGAGSVVTKSVERNVIVAGNPAKKLRKIKF